MTIPRFRSLFVGGLCFFTLWSARAAEPALVLTNHIGYDIRAPKRAVIRGTADDHCTDFTVKTYPDGREVLKGKAAEVGAVDHWRDWRFWTIDFSPVQDEGEYMIECRDDSNTLRSFPFKIQKDVLERSALFDVVSYFKGQRCSGALDEADRHMTFLGSDRPPVDVHGGWYDATGDYGKHLSHLSFSTYHNPQQIPLVVYSLLQTHARLDQRHDENFAQLQRRLLDEGLFGADFLVRMHVSDGSFYETIANRGPGKKPEDRRITPASSPGFGVKAHKPTETEFKATEEPAKKQEENYQVSFRAGGGMAIAALALASRQPLAGEFSSADYLKTAEAAFAFLDAHNRELTNDGKENIVDDYCVLLAATELARATKKPAYAAAAQKRAESLLDRLVSRDTRRGYWRADDRDRPFFHAADAGLPVVALLQYRDLADGPTQARIAEVVRRSLAFELGITEEVPNPFGLAREYVQNKAGQRRTTFFYPHDSETAPWWQGENARLASLATAARAAIPLYGGDPDFQRRLRAYALNQLNWILGLNPFDACMLQGEGRHNPEYMFFGTYQYHNAPGGICNGITSGFKDESDIALNLPPEITGGDHDWRWGEQWLPHAAWFLFAVAEGD